MEHRIAPKDSSVSQSPSQRSPMAPMMMSPGAVAAATAMAAAAQPYFMRLNAAPDAPNYLLTAGMMDLQLPLSGNALPIQPEEHSTALFLQQQRLLQAMRASPMPTSRPESPNAHSTSAASGGGGGPKPKKCPRVCAPCKKAKTACDVQRPCSRCVRLSQADTCIDVSHKVQARRSSSTPPVGVGIAKEMTAESVASNRSQQQQQQQQQQQSAMDALMSALVPMHAAAQAQAGSNKAKRGDTDDADAAHPMKRIKSEGAATPLTPNPFSLGVPSPFSSASSPDPIDFPWECLFDLQSIPDVPAGPAQQSADASTDANFPNAEVLQSLFAIFGGAMAQGDESGTPGATGASSEKRSGASNDVATVPAGSDGAASERSGSDAASAPSAAGSTAAGGAPEDDSDTDFVAEGLAMPKKWPNRKPFNVRDYFASVFGELKRWKQRMLQRPSAERMRACFIVYLRFYIQQSTMFRAFTHPELNEQKKELLEGLEFDPAMKNLMTEDEEPEEPAVDMSESVTRLVYEKIPVAVVRCAVKNFGIRVTYANPMASAMFGYDDGEVIKTPLCDELLFRAFHESEWHRFAKECCASVAARAEKFQFRGLFANKNGETFEAVLSVSITYSGRGIPKNATIFIQKSDVVRRDSLMD